MADETNDKPTEGTEEVTESTEEVAQEEAAEDEAPPVEEDSKDTSDEEVAAVDADVEEEATETEEEASTQLPEFRVGDTVNVHYRVVEGAKTRVQPYEGLVIAMKGSGNARTFTVRRISKGGLGVERIFPLYSPNIAKLEVKKRGMVRRSKLYFLRERVGKGALKVREKRD